VLIEDRLGLVASLQFGLGSPYDCHVYALKGESGLVLIDAGSGYATESLLDRANRCFPGVRVSAVVLTHAHPDHAAGAARLRELTSCAVFASDVSVEAIRTGDERATGLEEARAQGIYPAEVVMKACPQVQVYRDGEPLEAGGIEFLPIAVRGHSADSHCLLTELDGRRLLFSGDAIFYGAVLGVINREDSGMSGYRADLPKLARRGIDALLPGHGLFTLARGQRHIDKALELVQRGFLPRQIGQMDLIF
jgi:glyoxylase-like metal-dependent hydrolase (beta-lactamase superfamily II)